MSNVQIKHILFDTDGVIVHSDMWSLEYAHRSGISSDLMKPFFTGVFQECILGEADLEEVIIPFLKLWNYSGTPEEFMHEWFTFESHIDMALIDRVQKLRKSGIQCHVATNQEKNRLNYLKNEMHFSEYFDSIYCSSVIGYKKPQKEFYTYILNTLNIENPSEILYFDDAEENILGARGLSISGVLYTGFEAFEQTLTKEGIDL